MLGNIVGQYTPRLIGEELCMDANTESISAVEQCKEDRNSARSLLLSLSVMSMGQQQIERWKELLLEQ